MRCVGAPIRFVFGPVLGLVLALGACAPEPQGPAAPIAAQQIGSGAAIEAAAARQAVVDFVTAYAASPTGGSAALQRLVAGRELASWSRWLDVQHREFPGTIDAAADVRDIRFVTALEAQEARGAQVGLEASVTFQYSPDGEDPFELARVLDGVVTLLRLDDGEYRVIDLVRDGVPMSAGIHVFQDQVRRGGALEIELDSLFMFAPSWQFNVIVRNDGPEAVTVDPLAAGLYVSGGGEAERLEGTISPSLTVIPPGAEVAGILGYGQQDSAADRVLTLVFGTGRRSMRFEFPLDGLVTMVPPPAPATEASPAAATA
jgi:hypothetical protein